MIFDNFAKMLRSCLKGNTQEIPEIVMDTRMVWEMCLEAEAEVSPSFLSGRLGKSIFPSAFQVQHCCHCCSENVS